MHLCFISKPPDCGYRKIMTILEPVPETVDVYADSRITGIRIWSPDIVHKLHAGEYLVWVRKQLIYIIEETLSEEAVGYPYL